MIRRAGDLHAVVEHALHRLRERGAGGVAERNVEEPRRAGGRRRAAERLPRVQRNVVVVAAGGEERGRPPGLLHLEPEHVAVERDGSVEVGDLQVDMTDVGAGIDRLCHAESLAPARIQTTYASQGVPSTSV